MCACIYHDLPVERQQKANYLSRYIQNNIYVRIIVSVARTTRNVFRAPFRLASNGSNNPIDLPNIRFRDALALLLVGGDLCDSYGLDPWIEETAAALLEFFGACGSEEGEWVFKTLSDYVMDSLINEPLFDEINLASAGIGMPGLVTHKVVAKHNICNCGANLQWYFGRSHLYNNQKESILRQAKHVTLEYADCSKAWYCKYLYSTGRTPVGIPRSEHPTIIACTGPMLHCDYFTAYDMLKLSTSIISMCRAEPTCDVDTYRMIVSLVGIAPHRRLWSQSRRPDEGKLTYMMLNGCPSLVIPVECSNAPVLAWDCKPVKELWKLKDDELECHARNVVEYLHSLIDYDYVELPARMAGKITPKKFLDHAVRKIIQMAVLARYRWPMIRKNSKRRFSSDHTGIVFLRYTNISALRVHNRREGSCHGPALPAMTTIARQQSLSAPTALAPEVSALTLNDDEQRPTFQMNTTACPKVPSTVLADGTAKPLPLVKGIVTVPVSVEYLGTSPVQEAAATPA
ncbi:hypothetical protein HDU85_004927 [Gaertneriomyces sp. JEL0708]|nr:hypothetical protein HDU85_004927 [Gaertneriomyces sp. JEL0708]